MGYVIGAISLVLASAAGNWAMFAHYSKRTDGKIGQLDQKIDAQRIELGSRIDVTNARIDGLGSRLDAMHTRVEALSTRVGALSTRVEAINNRIDNMSSRLDGLTTKVIRLAGTGVRPA